MNLDRGRIALAGDPTWHGAVARMDEATIREAAEVLAAAHRYGVTGLDDAQLLHVAEAVGVLRAALREVEAQVLLTGRATAQPRLSWHDLATAAGYPSTHAAQDRYRRIAALRGGAAAEYVLTYGPTGWSLRVDGRLLSEHGGIGADRVGDARAWAAVLISGQAGRAVSGWAVRTDGVDGEEQLALLGEQHPFSNRLSPGRPVAGPARK